MRYLKLLISSIVLLFLAVIAIWSGVFILIFSVVATPILAWWLNRKAHKSMEETTSESPGPESKKTASYKVIEAEYEIIEK